MPDSQGAHSFLGVLDRVGSSLKGRNRVLGPVVGHTAACLLFGTIILAHVGLLPLSRWQADEYLYAALLREGGAAYVADRFVHWAPRPWSELLLWVYGVAINHAHRPLSGRFDVLLWAGLGLACVSPALGRPGQRLRLAAFGLSLFVFYLLGHMVAEIFFWPSGAAAYLPTLAGITWLFWCVALPDRPVPAWQAGTALLLTAGSSEVGLFFTFAFAACAAVLALRHGAWRYAWALPALALASLDLWLLLHGRAGSVEQAGAAGSTYHHAWQSLWAGLRGLPGEMLASSVFHPGPADPVLNVLSWGLAILGGRWCLGALPQARGGELASLILALVGTAVLTRAAAYDQFGELCCQRHEAMRHCLIMLAMIAAGIWSGAVWPSRGATGTLGLAAIVCAAALLAIPRVSPLIATYRQIPSVLSARAATWQSGLSPGPAMTMVMEPGSPLLPELGGFSPGTTRLDQPPPLPWYDRGVMLFFDKKVLTIVRPEQ